MQLKQARDLQVGMHIAARGFSELGGKVDVNAHIAQISVDSRQLSGHI